MILNLAYPGPNSQSSGDSMDFSELVQHTFKDLGFDAVNSFITNIIDNLDFTDVLYEDNYKDLLLKYSQKLFKNCTPEYHLVSTEGPPHNRMFQVVVSINGNIYVSTNSLFDRNLLQCSHAKVFIIILRLDLVRFSLFLVIEAKQISGSPPPR